MESFQLNLDEEFKDFEWFGESHIQSPDDDLFNSSLEHLIQQCSEDISDGDLSLDIPDFDENNNVEVFTIPDQRVPSADECSETAHFEIYRHNSQVDFSITKDNFISTESSDKEHILEESNCLPNPSPKVPLVYKFKIFDCTKKRTKKSKNAATDKANEKKLLKTIKDLQRENSCLKELL